VLRELDAVSLRDTGKDILETLCRFRGRYPVPRLLGYIGVAANPAYSLHSLTSFKCHYASSW
jgi:hypothetical protein